jgi:hypothetical protein
LENNLLFASFQLLFCKIIGQISLQKINIAQFSINIYFSSPNTNFFVYLPTIRP